MSTRCAAAAEARIQAISLAWAIVCCAVIAPRTATAAEDRAAAKAHYESATRLYDIHEYEAALEEYKAGYLVKPDPSFLYNIGQCYKKLGQAKKAREFFREYLRKADLDEQKRAQAEARLRELDAIDSATTPSPLVSPTRSEPEPAPRAIPVTAASPEPAGTPAAGLDLSSTDTTGPEPSAQPYHKTWWFWTGVGAVVAAGTVTTILLLKGDNQLSIDQTSLGSRRVLQ